jgi:hypothetical protein
LNNNVTPLALVRSIPKLQSECQNPNLSQNTSIDGEGAGKILKSELPREFDAEKTNANDEEEGEEQVRLGVEFASVNAAGRMSIVEARKWI